MITLSNAIILCCLFSFFTYIAIISKVEDSKNLSGTIFTNSSIGMIIFIVLGLTPLYFLYQTNSILITILKFLGLSILTLVLTAIIYRKNSVGSLSLNAIAFSAISILLIIIYILR
jgi:hypothetical protein